MDLNHPSDEAFARFVDDIAKHVRCEMERAVALEYSPRGKRQFLYNWASKIALTIRAADRGRLSPGVSTTSLSGIFSFGAGASVQTDGSREMTMTYYLPFNQLLHFRKAVNLAGQKLECAQVTPEPIAGDLGISQSFAAALQAWDRFETLGERVSDGPFDTITHHVTFQVEAAVSATPSWKFVRVSVNPSDTLASATRTTTNELLITIGPKALGDRKELNESFYIERLRSVIRRP